MNYNYDFYKELNINGLRYPKIFNFNYAIYLLKLDKQLNIIEDLGFVNIEELDYLEDISSSGWIRNIKCFNNEIHFIIEIKKNINNEEFNNINFLIKTKDLIKFKIIKKFDINDFLFENLFINNNNYYLTSIIEKDLKDINYFWGKYLFSFVKNDIKYRPIFDKYINYENDKGHLLHNIVKIENEYKILFSIRHKKNNIFFYNIYESYSKDLLNFYNTMELKLNYNNSEWYSYPHLFNHNNKEYIVCNQDDFGKNKNPLIFIKDKYKYEINFIKYNYKNIDYNSIKLLFNENKNYIYFNELKNKKGKRYNEIIKMNKNLNEYSTHSPSCHMLYDVLKKLNINNNDKIIDIGSGKGFALLIMNLFPFKKIYGIEINENDNNICKNNLEQLKINRIELKNDSIENFNNYNEFNYFYFYNPFSDELFENTIKNIKLKDTIIIFKNIHSSKILILKKYNFNLIFENKGVERNYYIYKKI
jgi:precorrin-6B methylase 2